MLISSHEAWPLTKLEIADGFYSPCCAIVRYVLDHFAPAVLLSNVVVGVLHSSFWGDFISGERLRRGGCEGSIAHQPLPYGS